MRWLEVLGLAAATGAQLQADLTSTSSIRDAAREVAYDLMTYYKGNQSGQIPGILPGPPPVGPYYWWEGGALWGTLIDYYHFTKDPTYNEVVMQAMQFQVGEKQNFMPYNWTASMGNDDQSFWAMSAMLAAELNFPNPPEGKPQWLALAQAVFNTQLHAPSRDNACGGGLRWQAILGNTGWTYKNTIANACFFNIGVRLARYTNNDTYAQIAVKTFDWLRGVGYIDGQYNVYDGAHDYTNCTDINKQQFSYNAAVLLQGAAFMYNYTNGDPTWEAHVNGLLTQLISVFFPNGIATEIACELDNTLSCTPDMLSFKGYVARWMATVAQVAPFTSQRILSVLSTSAAAAVQQCTGSGAPGNGRTCGFRWNRGAYDGTSGAGQEMNVLGALVSLLAPDVNAPLTAATGGTSQGNYDAGDDPEVEPPKPITTADRAGAGILTALLLTMISVTFVWMSTEYYEGKFD